MPIYDYSCAACGAVTEVVHGIHDPTPRFCPACGAEGSLKKAFAPPAVHFKGSGWAKKDRGASTSTKAAAKGGSAASPSGADKGGSPESPAPAPSPSPSTASSGGED